MQRGARLLARKAKSSAKRNAPSTFKVMIRHEEPVRMTDAAASNKRRQCPAMQATMTDLPLDSAGYIFFAEL